MGETILGGERWLKVVSGAMAVFCGVVGLVLALMVVTMLAGVAITDWNNKSGSWRIGSEGVASAGFERSVVTSCRSGEEPLCAPSGPPTIKSYVSQLLGQLIVQAPLAALAYGLFQASACFVEIARGRMLARRTVHRLVRFSIAGLTFVVLAPQAGRIAGFVANGAYKLMSLIAGDKSFSFSSFTTQYIGMHGVLTVIYAVALTIIAVILVKASTIAEDHAQIV
jgi:hypothetical protein